MSFSLAFRGVVPASRLGERPAPPTVLTGIGEFDALTGGLPRGGLSEICGPASSGRTSVLLALMAKMTRQGEVCALVDASDSFDPQSAEAAGVDLKRLLWVRCSKNRVIGRSGDRVIGTSGRWSGASGQQKSQITNRKSQMNSLEQALKAADLLLQGGGFGLVAMDLGDVPAAAAGRVPLTSWFRFRRAVENTATVLLVLEQEPHAKTCASLVTRLSASRQENKQWAAMSNQPDGIAGPAHARVLRGLKIRAEVIRDRNQGKKPARSANACWQSRTAWAG